MLNADTITDPVQTWHDFLRRQGAVIEAGETRAFGEPAAERRAAGEHDVLVDLSHFSLIQASGADALTFLNGQLTCDARDVTPERSRLGAWCSPKGRMLALFRVLRRDDGYLLQLPAPLAPDVLKRLRLYVLRAQVTLAPADATWLRFGLAGPNAPALAQAALGAAPAADGTVATADDAIVCRLPGFHPRFQILAPLARAMALWQRLAGDALPVGSPAWAWHDIVAGIPAVLPETIDSFIPQMANLDLLGGISFTKGCYTGQEIVARLHYRGRLKQRMYRLHVEGDRTPAPGTPVYAPRSDQSSGTVVIGAPAPAGGQDMLAVIYSDRIDAELRLGTPDGPRLEVLPLPYAVSLPEAP